jgi:hypothetical protein
MTGVYYSVQKIVAEMKGAVESSASRFLAICCD